MGRDRQTLRGVKGEAVGEVGSGEETPASLLHRLWGFPCAAGDQGLEAPSLYLAMCALGLVHHSLTCWHTFSFLASCSIFVGHRHVHRGESQCLQGPALPAVEASLLVLEQPIEAGGRRCSELGVNSSAHARISRSEGERS